MLHVCEDEYQLYTQFFSTPADRSSDQQQDQSENDDSQLDDFLETLCLILYDNLRPLIIHITHLETLAELTSILRNEVVGQHCVQHPQLLAFKRVVTQMLADVQVNFSILITSMSFIFVNKELLNVTSNVNNV